MNKRCRNCEHCVLIKGLSQRYYLCDLRPIKDKPAREKWLEKVKPNECCDKHEFKKGIIQ